MDKQAIFTELVGIVERNSDAVDTAELPLDDRPFREHGIDSMTLIKLVGEVEDRFGIEIEDADAMVAFSFQRLVDLVARKVVQNGGTVEEPANLYAWVRAAATASGERAVMTVRGSRGGDVVMTHRELLAKAAWLGGRLPAVDGPRTVLVVASEPLPAVIGFLAAIATGAKPLIMPAPKSLGGFDAFAARLAQVADGFAGSVTLAVQEGLLPRGATLPDRPQVALPTAPAAYGSEGLPPVPAAGGDDVAFLQMTSASTGDAKLVAISHTNVTANLEAMRVSLQMGDGRDEAVVSWLPLNHDMGLIGGMLFPLLNGFPNVIMKPNEFIRDPARWIRTLSDTGATFGGCPNFGWDYAALAVRDQDLEGVDLSKARRMAVAAEPIHRAALQRFADRFGPVGFRPDAFVPGLGLAESTLASTTRAGREPRYLLVGAGGQNLGAPVKIYGEGVVRYPAEPVPDTPGVAIFSLGPPVPGVTVALIGEDGDPIADEGVLGEVTIAGPSVSVGYYDPAAERPVPFPGGVLRTGDLGFFDDGELFLLGRMKNVIIRRGANFLASLLEERVGEVLGIPPFGIALFDEDIYDAESPVHVVVENAWDGIQLTAGQISDLRSLDLPVDVITFARGFSLPRTTSGKKRYHLIRQAVAGHSLDVIDSIRLVQRE